MSDKWFKRALVGMGVLAALFSVAMLALVLALVRWIWTL